MIEPQRSPRVGLLLLLPLAALLFAVGCGDSGGTEPQPEPWFEAGYLSSYDQAYSCFPNSAAHAGSSVRIHLSGGQRELYEAARDSAGVVLPVGTTIVKTENLGSACDGALFRQTVMRKRRGGTVSDISDWEWQEVDARGAVTREGQISECISCHTGCGPEWDYTCFDPTG